MAVAYYRVRIPFRSYNEEDSDSGSCSVFVFVRFRVSLEWIFSVQQSSQIIDNLEKTIQYHYHNRNHNHNHDHKKTTIIMMSAYTQSWSHASRKHDLNFYQSLNPNKKIRNLIKNPEPQPESLNSNLKSWTRT